MKTFGVYSFLLFMFLMNLLALPYLYISSGNTEIFFVVINLIGVLFFLNVIVVFKDVRIAYIGIIPLFVKRKPKTIGTIARIYISKSHSVKIGLCTITFYAKNGDSLTIIQPPYSFEISRIVKYFTAKHIPVEYNKNE